MKIREKRSRCASLKKAASKNLFPAPWNGAPTVDGEDGSLSATTISRPESPVPPHPKLGNAFIESISTPGHYEH
jgi:hypothetical protein